MSDYEKIIGGIYTAWNDLKNHPYPDTKGVDDSSINTFKESVPKNIKEIRDQLNARTYKFSALRSHYIEKKNSKNKRLLLIGTIKDRIVSKAILNAVGKKLDRSFKTDINYCPVLRGRKKGKNIQQAVIDIKNAFSKGYVWAFETDIQKFFDEIDKSKLEKLITAHVDSETLGLIKQIIHFSTHGLDPKEVFRKDYGVAQGSSISPLLANIYLNEFDKVLMKIDGVVAIRYVDDLVVLCKTKQKAEEVKQIVVDELKKIGLSVNEDKTRIIDMGIKALEFLGIQFVGSTVKLPTKKRKALDTKLARLLNDRKNTSIHGRLIKTKRVLRANIKYYKSLDRNDFQGQLMKVTDDAETQALKLFEKEQKEILNKDIYERVKPAEKTQHLKFIGLSFNDLKIEVVKGATSPIEIKDGLA